MSSTKGHHFAHPTNKFWVCVPTAILLENGLTTSQRALHSSGLTSRLLDPSEDHLMPDEYSYGLVGLLVHVHTAVRLTGR